MCGVDVVVVVVVEAVVVVVVVMVAYHFNIFVYVLLFEALSCQTSLFFLIFDTQYKLCI